MGENTTNGLLTKLSFRIFIYGHQTEEITSKTLLGGVFFVVVFLLFSRFLTSFNTDRYMIKARGSLLRNKKYVDNRLAFKNIRSCISKACLKSIELNTFRQ